MVKLLILLVIIAGAFWLGRLSASGKKDKISKNTAHDKSVIDIDIEIEREDES